MNIYEVLAEYMRSLSKQKGHLSTQLQGVVEPLVQAWESIPKEHQGKLYDAAMEAAKAFNLGFAPPFWLKAFTECYRASQKSA